MLSPATRIERLDLGSANEITDLAADFDIIIYISQKKTTLQPPPAPTQIRVSLDGPCALVSIENCVSSLSGGLENMIITPGVFLPDSRD